ncbi:MAG TPA: hypothetical protein VL442_18070 [Mucilaginibacter sp.]|jgi:hypothetical protein|nr:hypothetical protein [Mucilaginibacter sp.]
MDSKIELAKPRDFGETITDTFGFIKQNFKPLLKYFFIFCGFFLFATFALTVLTEVKVISFVTATDSFDESNNFSRMFSLLGGYLLLMLFILLTYVAINVMVLCFMTLYKQKENTVPTTEEMWGYFKYYYLRVLGSSVLLYILMCIGMVFCLIPGIYLSPIFALVPAIMIMENTSFGYAFNQSFKLIKDNWWVTFGIIVVMYIILYVLNLFISIPSFILGIGNVFLHIKDTKAVSLPIAIGMSLLQTVQHAFQMLILVAVGMCYFSLHESKEGTGLMERINQFGSGDTHTDTTQEEY